MNIFDLIEELKQYDYEADVVVCVARDSIWSIDPEDTLDIQGIDSDVILVLGDDPSEFERKQRVILEVS